jgi:hypothetical protein
MKFKKQAIAIAACYLLSQNVEASVTLNMTGDKLQTATAGTAAPISGLVILVANTSTTSGSFGATSIQTGAPLTLGGAIIPGDVILKEWTVGGASGTAGAFYDTTGAISLAGAGIAAGNPLALLWFPTLTTGATSAPAGTAYGIYTGPGTNGSAAWTVPADGSTVALTFATTNGVFTVGTAPSSAGVASLTVAPEPSRMILAAIGVGLISLRRRRR